MESTIGLRIRQLREDRRLSVADFARAAGVKPSAVYGLGARLTSHVGRRPAGGLCSRWGSRSDAQKPRRCGRGLQ